MSDKDSKKDLTAADILFRWSTGIGVGGAFGLLLSDDIYIRAICVVVGFFVGWALEKYHKNK